MRASLIVFSVALLVALPGCKRGSLATWLQERSASVKSASPVTMLNGTDCPDGLARCIGGTVEVSRVARVPRPCPASDRPECQCPWDGLEICPRGCTVEGTDVVTPPDRAAARLCAPDPADPPARPAPGAVAPVGACEADGYRCVASLVVSCTQGGSGLTPQVLAACVRGCFHDGEALGEEEADPQAAARILCAR